MGLVVSIGFAGLALVLHLAGLGLVRAVKPLATASWFPLRHAVNGLRRPGNQTRVILLAVGLGSFFVLGGIGVWSVTRVFVRQKIRSVAILKCVGATTRQVLATYVLQVLLLGFSGSALGVALAGLGLSAIPKSVSTAFGGLPYGLTTSAVVQGMGVGLMVSLLFALVPLLEVRRVKPLLLIRGLTPEGARRWRWRAIDWTSVVTAVAVSIALVALAS